MRSKVLSRGFTRLLNRQVEDGGAFTVSVEPSHSPILHHREQNDFENHFKAFQRKSSWEISRSLAILLLCGCNKFVDNSEQLMAYSQKILGRKAFRSIIKPTFYSQFVGGETPEEITSCIEKLRKAGVQPLLACTLEDDCGGRKEDVYDRNVERILDSMKMTLHTKIKIPMTQLKLTGLLSADLLITISNIFTASNRKEQLIESIANCMTRGSMKDFQCDKITSKQKDKLESGVKRLREIAEVAKEKNVKLLIDAEYTYLNPGLSLLALAMMLCYNASTPLVWNTYQCYLKKTWENLKMEMNIANKFGTCFGAKVVRGAYITRETDYALQKGLPYPICDSYELTSKNYNNILSYLLQHISNFGPRCNIIIASHNEESIKFAIKKMNQLAIDKQSGGVYFGQLYGMCDQITYPLASMGYLVYKSVPYGTVEEVLPYLARRATENRSVLLGARKERELLWKHLKFRVLGN
ncbi:hydroxyproline dehydrogenase-like [Centruroides sculpturatus]|uniref:hydroxyproline dehydrogenase-like n=1 Tax=Centruroides sculpturatus TaxID=218467 RepID=UPI000C6E6CA5|nr:hydroxyproline dehydrogenase-like [Centruroides sculpturatus]